MTEKPQLITARWVLPIATPPIENGFVQLEKGRIANIGRYHDLPQEWQVPPPKPGSILSPGLINCHIHLEQSYPEPIHKEQDAPFTDWLLNVIQLIKVSASSEEKQARCITGADELLRTGTTCINDIASGPESLQVLEQKGLRGLVSLEVFHPGYEQINIDFWIKAYRQFAENYQANPQLATGLSPHSPYNVSPAAWRKLVDACQPTITHTHVAEFEDEVRYLQGKPSSLPHLHQTILQQTFSPQALADSPVAYLHRFGLLNNRTIVAHAVHVNEEDIQPLAQAGVTVAHCPRSNLALHQQTLRASQWQHSGIPIGLGTDGRLSTTDLDLRAEARCAMQHHGWSATQALAAMTLEGAKALNLEREVGSLEVGKWADLVLWQSDPFQIALPQAQLLVESTTVEQVWVAGQSRWQKVDA